MVVEVAHDEQHDDHSNRKAYGAAFPEVHNVFYSLLQLLEAAMSRRRSKWPQRSML